MARKPLKLSDICWLAGLLEGEGSFGGTHTPKPYWYPLIQVRSTDRDVVQRAADVFGGYAVGGPYRQTGRGAKPIYGTKVSGSPAAGWMMTLYSQMGTRRRARIREVLDKWRARA